MSKALDKLDATVTESVKDGTAAKNMSRDQLLDYSISISTALKTHLQFFGDLADRSGKMQEKLLSERATKKSCKMLVIWDALQKNLIGIAKARQEQKFCGALVESMQACVMVLDEVVVNIDKLFKDKTFNLYNTKISHVAIYGVLDSAATLSAFVEAYIPAILTAMQPDLFKIAPYREQYLDSHVEAVADICCRMINGKMGKTFAAGVMRYKASGNDVGVLTTDNQSAAKFAKLGGEVSESDVKAGCRGLHIFRVIGDYITDFFDWRARKLRALREQHKARVEFLQMELDGEDPNSERYKRIVKIIKNYDDLIARLDQKIDKYYNED